AGRLRRLAAILAVRPFAAMGAVGLALGASTLAVWLAAITSTALALRAGIAPATLAALTLRRTGATLVFVASAWTPQQDRLRLLGLGRRFGRSLAGNFGGIDRRRGFLGRLRSLICGSSDSRGNSLFCRLGVGRSRGCGDDFFGGAGRIFHIRRC